MENQMTISTISDEVYDDVFIYKLFSNKTLLESLKQVGRPEVFTAVYVYKLKVCAFYYWKYITDCFELIYTGCLQDEIESLKKEGRVYEIAELVLTNGACRNLVPGWSKGLLTSLEMNSLKEIYDAVKPSQLFNQIFNI